MRFKLILLVFILIFVEFSESYEICGDRRGVALLSIGGIPSAKNQWPWLDAFVHTQANSFFCGGSLVSERHVLSGELMNFSHLNL
jgi:secreted trypsin-like serine protease